MAMLGALHKINLEKAPLQFTVLFPRVGSVVEPLLRQRLRFWRPLHSKQLGTLASFTSSEVMKRSVFGLAHCYNALPQRVADTTSVKLFQRELQCALLKLAERECADWPQMFAGIWKRFPRSKFDELF